MLKVAYPSVLALFSHQKETLQEDFVGVARNRKQADVMAEYVESKMYSCWIEEVTIKDWYRTRLRKLPSDVIFLVFRSGPAQEEERRADDFDPELVGAFTSKLAAERYAVALDRRVATGNPLHTKLNQHHVWEAHYGFLPKYLKADGIPIPAC